MAAMPIYGLNLLISPGLETMYVASGAWYTYQVCSNDPGLFMADQGAGIDKRVFWPQYFRKIEYVCLIGFKLTCII